MPHGCPQGANGGGPLPPHWQPFNDVHPAVAREQPPLPGEKASARLNGQSVKVLGLIRDELRCSEMHDVRTGTAGMPYVRTVHSD